jgi:hypothetical protein
MGSTGWTGQAGFFRVGRLLSVFFYLGCTCFSFCRPVTRAYRLIGVVVVDAVPFCFFQREGLGRLLDKYVRAASAGHVCKDRMIETAAASTPG